LNCYPYTFSDWFFTILKNLEISDGGKLNPSFEYFIEFSMNDSGVDTLLRYIDFDVIDDDNRASKVTEVPSNPI
jgi:hypothetical protein